jgi:acyl-CoA synthetase (AMP-forming)/AMP-acid ligase II
LAAFFAAFSAGLVALYLPPFDGAEDFAAALDADSR